MNTDTTVHRDFEPEVTLAQIGAGTIAAVSGGRWTVHLSVEHDPDGTSHPVPVLELPCGRGYRVEIQLGADDTYTVRRIHRRGGARTVKGVAAGIHFPGLAEQVYRAGMSRDPWPLGGVG